VWIGERAGCTSKDGSGNNYAGGTACLDLVKLAMKASVMGWVRMRLGGWRVGAASGVMFSVRQSRM
jgi:hypothetical protein